MIRAGEGAIRDLGLTLDPNDPLTLQGAASVDQPLARQTDESLLALASLRDPKTGELVEYTFTCRPSAAGYRLRWDVPQKERVRELYLTWVIPRLANLQPLELDGRSVRALPEQGLEYPAVREIAWGSGDQQVSINFVAPAKVVLRPGGGDEAWVSALVEPIELAKGQLEVGFDLEGASQRARQALAALLGKARTAQRLGRLSEALEAYAEVERRFPHDEEGKTSAREGSTAIKATGGRLIEVIRWAAREAQEVPAPELLSSARSALSELAEALPGTNLLSEGQQALREVEDAVLGTAKAQHAAEVARLVAKGRALRLSGKVHLAREIYEHVIARYGAEVTGVDEAKRLLAAMNEGSGQ